MSIRNLDRSGLTPKALFNELKGLVRSNGEGDSSGATSLDCSSHVNLSVTVEGGETNLPDASSQSLFLPIHRKQDKCTDEKKLLTACFLSQKKVSLAETERETLDTTVDDCVLPPQEKSDAQLNLSKDLSTAAKEVVRSSSADREITTNSCSLKSGIHRQSSAERHESVENQENSSARSDSARSSPCTRKSTSALLGVETNHSADNHSTRTIAGVETGRTGDNCDLTTGAERDHTIDNRSLTTVVEADHTDDSLTESTRWLRGVRLRMQRKLNFSTLAKDSMDSKASLNSTISCGGNDAPITELERWTVGVLPDQRFYLGGYTKDSQGNESFLETDPIAKCLKSDLIQTASGALFKISGKLNRSSSPNGGIPRKLHRRFSDGFPADWEDLLPVAANTSKRQSLEAATSLLSSTTDSADCSSSKQTVKQAIGDVKMALLTEGRGLKNAPLDVKELPVARRSGRIKIPPLAWWANQRVIVDPKNNETSITQETDNVLGLPAVFFHKNSNRLPGENAEIKRNKLDKQPKYSDKNEPPAAAMNSEVDSNNKRRSRSSGEEVTLSKKSSSSAGTRNSSTSYSSGNEEPMLKEKLLNKSVKYNSNKKRHSGRNRTVVSNVKGEHVGASAETVTWKRTGQQKSRIGNSKTNHEVDITSEIEPESESVGRKSGVVVAKSRASTHPTGMKVQSSRKRKRVSSDSDTQDEPGDDLSGYSGKESLAAASSNPKKKKRKMVSGSSNSYGANKSKRFNLKTSVSEGDTMWGGEASVNEYTKGAQKTLQHDRAEVHRSRRAKVHGSTNAAVDCADQRRKLDGPASSDECKKTVHKRRQAKIDDVQNNVVSTSEEESGLLGPNCSSRNRRIRKNLSPTTQNDCLELVYTKASTSEKIAVTRHNSRWDFDEEDPMSFFNDDSPSGSILPPKPKPSYSLLRANHSDTDDSCDVDYFFSSDEG